MLHYSNSNHEGVQIHKFGDHPFLKPSMYIHLYYLDGLLIDTGQSHARQKLLSVLKGLDINKVFLTHHHEDHTGNIKEIEKSHQCKILASPDCCKIMQQPPKISLAQKLIWGSRPDYHSAFPIENTIETNKYIFKIIPVSGHAPDMCVLYEPNKGWLFSADLFIHEKIGYFLKGEKVSLQIESLKKVLKLDFDTLFCSHNPQWTKGKEALQNKLNYLEELQSKVLELHINGYSTNQIIKTLKLKRYHLVKLLSSGLLSPENMVESITQKQTFTL